jgi:hypothetical protein
LVKAVDTAACPVKPDRLKGMIETKMGKQVVIGTQTY